MKLDYGVPQGLRFLTDLSHQNRFRKGGTANVFKLLCPKNRILPFQIKTDETETALNSLVLYSLETESSSEILGTLANGQLRNYTVSGSRYFVHYGSLNLSQTIAPGEYYLIAGSSSKVWYSEVFTVGDFNYDISGRDCDMTRIEYWSTCDIDDIFYRGQYT